MFIQNVRTSYLHPIQTLLYNSIHFVRVLILVLICIFMLKHENRAEFSWTPSFFINLSRNVSCKRNARSESGGYSKSKLKNGMPKGTVSPSALPGIALLSQEILCIKLCKYYKLHFRFLRYSFFLGLILISINILQFQSEFKRIPSLPTNLLTKC